MQKHKANNSNKPKPKQQKKKAPQQSATRVINAPVAKTQVSRTPAPRINRSFPNGDVEVEHTEFLGDISGSVAFAVNAFAINPGLYTSFPWLYQMAQLYESYRFSKLRFEFRTEAATSSTGSVMGVVDYDPSDPAPTSKVQMATYRGYRRSAPWNNFVQESIAEDLNKRKSYFVRNGAVAANQDIQLFDVGNFFLATERQADTTVVGELYVHYKVRFMTPQLSNPGLGSALSSRYSWQTSQGTSVITISGSKAPLVCTVPGGNPGSLALTANAPYNGLVCWVGRGDGPMSLTTTGTTATFDTLQVGSTTGTAQVTCANVQVSFQPGQMLVLTPTVACTNAGISVGQFDSVQL
jgi:hypothetical protein